MIDNLQDEPEFYSDVRKLLSRLKNRLKKLNNLKLIQFPDLNERNKLRLYIPIIENLFFTRNNKGNL